MPLSDKLRELDPRYACCFCCMFPFLALAIAGILEQRRYTPIYEDVFCKPTSTALGGVNVAPISTTIDLFIRCTNPNPFEITVSPASSGKILLGQQREAIGGSSYGDPATITPEAVSYFVVHADVRPTMLQTIRIGNALLRGPFTIFFDLDLVVTVDATLMAISLPTLSMPVKQKCGIELQLLPSDNSGDAVCGDTYEELKVPRIAEKSTDETEGMRPEMDTGTIAEAERMRDSFCGTIIALGFLVSFLSCLVPLCYLAWSLWRARKVGSANEVVVATTLGKQTA